KFYPDFVALLENDHILTVEYKGAYLTDTEDTKEKRLLGQLWASKSNGACKFLMVSDNDYEASLLSVEE
ncbi:MAG: hypothetical protein Q7N50_06695, partial [Armatimonadota bacterium]|nr:hypothetical protein [Armatimonadota bacterium]